MAASLSHRPLLGSSGQDSRKAEPTCPQSAPLPHPCSCHSCRSTGLLGAGSGSQTPPPQSSGGPHRCHGASCGQGQVRASAEEIPTHSLRPTEHAGALASLPTPASPNGQQGRWRREGNEGAESQVREQKEPQGDLETPAGRGLFSPQDAERD